MIDLPQMNITGSLHYQPKQCTSKREIPQNYHRFALFDPQNTRQLNDPCITHITLWFCGGWLTFTTTFVEGTLKRMILLLNYIKRRCESICTKASS